MPGRVLSHATDSDRHLEIGLLPLESGYGEGVGSEHDAEGTSGFHCRLLSWKTHGADHWSRRLVNCLHSVHSVVLKVFSRSTCGIVCSCRCVSSK